MSKTKKKLYSGHVGNGLVFWEEGDDYYKGQITEYRKISLDGKFTPENEAKIKEIAAKGNLLFTPLNQAEHLHINPASLELLFYSIEEINGKKYRCYRRGNKTSYSLDDENASKPGTKELAEVYQFWQNVIDKAQQAIDNPEEILIDYDPVHSKKYAEGRQEYLISDTSKYLKITEEEATKQIMTLIQA